ncbi:GNAT family N-acetyltransferase [Texcoconibacillus texcoconensis]|uniref:Putative GNAT superfamily acetyltransferase n=1 Tax=Texcoconibacillus texcoconensis TaxID=1095777 RepID=A0A840QRN6_9BACI|nr:GNAT family N-acetyltransferase [Texcoconibacillus texcoconensis]MBB5174025.1 putative GNAT superfamily acetyltransferase [Texcoconibacillus texcoconensis]
MTDQIEIRQLTTMDEIEQIQKIEEAVWNMSPIPIHQKYTASNNGGMILGAFDGEQTVGFLYSFPGFDGKKTYLCSHMLGILPAYRKSGLGMNMKLKQLEIAKRIGYDMITWTFDPLESLNAYLNLHKLGATGAYYKENHYRTLTDQLNKGLPTDRIQIEWYVNEKRQLPSFSVDESNVLLQVGNENTPVITDVYSHSFPMQKDYWLVGVPENFQTMKQQKPQIAEKWRYDSRQVFQSLFNEHYQAVDVIKDEPSNCHYYVFMK